VAGADTTAEAVNGVFEDTADGIVVLSWMIKLSAAAGGTATLLHRCKPVAGADTTAEAVNGVFEDTTDGIVAWSLMFKLPAAAGRHSHASASMQTCGWC
jgi:molybdopterin biosynthesis enzyme MoaB